MNSFLKYIPIVIVTLLLSSCEWLTGPDDDDNDNNNNGNNYTEDNNNNNSGNNNNESNSGPFEEEYPYNYSADIISCHENLDFKIYAIGLWTDGGVTVKFKVTNIGANDMSLDFRPLYSFDNFGNQYKNNSDFTVALGSEDGKSYATLPVGTTLNGFIHYKRVPTNVSSFQDITIDTYPGDAFRFCNVILPTRTVIYRDKSMKGVEILNPHEDIIADVIRCNRTTTGEVRVDFYLTNTSDTDHNISMRQSSYDSRSFAYDDQGYMGKISKVIFGSFDPQSSSNESGILPAHCYARCTMRISGISSNASELTHISLYSYPIGVMEFKNIQISK